MRMHDVSSMHENFDLLLLQAANTIMYMYENFMLLL